MTNDPVTRIELYYAIENAFSSPPVHAATLIAAAREHHARPEIIEALGDLPEGQPFKRLRDVWEHFPDMPTGAVDTLRTAAEGKN